jgi:hypothetical protein
LINLFGGVVSVSRKTNETDAVTLKKRVRALKTPCFVIEM